MKHIIKTQQFDRTLLKEIFKSASELEKNKKPYLKGKVMASLFYEPSTRTRLSFESAMYRLGGDTIHTENAKEFSSAIKGETLEDTIRVIGNYVDCITLRHPEKGASERAAAVSPVPVINAGDGAGQHPTQSLLDLYTIERELKTIDGISIIMMGDLKNGRTVRSLAYLLGKYNDIIIYFVSPIELRIGRDIVRYLKKKKIKYKELTSIDSVIKKADVVYQTRIQQERFKSEKEYLKFKGCLTIDKKTVKSMKARAIIMHPLPRVDEISTDVDTSPKAVYFRQAYYGVLVRMALLKLLLS